jgi:hypothetical protein
MPSREASATTIKLPEAPTIGLLPVFASTSCRRTRRCPPGVFQDGSAPLSIQSCAVLTEMPSSLAAWDVVRIDLVKSLSLGKETVYGKLAKSDIGSKFDRFDTLDG